MGFPVAGVWDLLPLLMLQRQIDYMTGNLIQTLFRKPAIFHCCHEIFFIMIDSPRHLHIQPGAEAGSATVHGAPV